MGDRLDSRRAIDNRWGANGLNGSDSRARGRVRDGGIGGAGRGLSAEFGDFDRDGRMDAVVIRLNKFPLVQRK